MTCVLCLVSLEWLVWSAQLGYNVLCLPFSKARMTCVLSSVGFDCLVFCAELREDDLSVVLS